MKAKEQGARKTWLIVILVVVIVIALMFLIRSITHPGPNIPKMKPGESFKELVTPPSAPQQVPQSAPVIPGR